MGHDVTEELKTSNLLIESEKEKTQIIDNSPEIIMYAGPNGKTNFISNQIGPMLGYSVEDFKGRSIPNEVIHPEDLSQLEGIHKELMKGKSVTVE